MTRITQQQLESYLWGAATRLRGTIDAGDYKQFIFPLLFFKRLSDVYDEEVVAAMEAFDGDEEAALLPENHRFQIPEGAHWSDVRDSTKDMGRAIQKAMRDIEAANPDKLAGIFGDAQWTNKDRLSDAMLRDLIEHFSSLELKLVNLPEDELGNGYEYLIKKFADDSGHTAAEFYTNRTVVHLMTEMLQPQPGESIYDPTCGSGGMLLSAVAHLKSQGKEWRNVKLYGQERNLMTSSIARMNCFLHGIEEFDIQRGDTLSDPKFVKGDKLQKFDVIFANPPYSIKQWDREAFASDKWGRNKYGTPPQGRADYAFWQHIIASMDPKTGRCAILFPHGVLFRQEEEEMRRKLIEADLVECVVGLGPNLFYNSPMEACIVICRARKPKERQGHVFLINAVNQVRRERSVSFLSTSDVDKIVQAYRNTASHPGFAADVANTEVILRNGNLSLPLYVAPLPAAAPSASSLGKTLAAWLSVAREGRSTGREHTELPALLADRTGWQAVQFGEVVKNVNETVERDGSGITRYVGLEHLEPGSLHVTSWGNVEDGTTFSRLCKPGQVLFGKRRAYQRKVAVASFKAVVSGDIYVLETRSDRLLPELLPFICLSERFFTHAVGTSAGSLSPRTNWSSLADFEFSLPPMNQQRKLAEILWAAVAAEDLLGTALRTGEAAVESHRDGIANGAYPQIRAEDVTQLVTKGESPGWQGFEYQTQGARFVTSENVLFGQFSPEPCKYIPLAFHEKLARSALKPGDILFNIVGASIGRACMVPELAEPANVNQAVAVIRVDSKKADPRFVLHAVLSPKVMRGLVGNSVNTARANISLATIRDAPLPHPPIADQRRLAEAIATVETARDQFRTRRSALRSFRDALTSEMLR